MAVLGAGRLLGALGGRGWVSSACLASPLAGPVQRWAWLDRRAQLCGCCVCGSLSAARPTVGFEPSLPALSFSGGVGEAHHLGLGVQAAGIDCLGLGPLCLS